MKMRQLPLAVKTGLAGALAAGAVGLPLPAQAAAIVIDTLNQPGQVLADGNDLRVTGTGSIIEATGHGVLASGGSHAFITVQSGGNIEANGTYRSGILVNAASHITGEVSNHGAISGQSNGIFIAADSRVDQGVVNSGLINAGSNGINLANRAVITGGISNAGGGVIQAHTGIHLTEDNIVHGGISNAGTLDVYSGIEVIRSTVDGNITNQLGGEINASNVGILASSGAIVAGDIVNAGTISVTGASYSDGISIGSSSFVTGGIINSGVLTTTGDGRAIFVGGGSTVTGGITNSGVLGGGLSIMSDATDLTNSGAIDIRDLSFTLSGDFTQTAGSLAFTLQTLTSYTGVPFDIWGDALLSGGDLVFNLDAGFVFENNQRITLFDIGGSRSGMFSNYGDDALVASFGGAGLFIDYTDEGNIELYSADLASGSVPAPMPAALMGLGMLGWRWSSRKGTRKGKPAEAETESGTA